MTALDLSKAAVELAEQLAGEIAEAEDLADAKRLAGLVRRFCAHARRALLAEQLRGGAAADDPEDRAA